MDVGEERTNQKEIQRMTNVSLKIPAGDEGTLSKIRRHHTQRSTRVFDFEKYHLDKLFAHLLAVTC